MIEVRRCTAEDEQQRALAVNNAVWPWYAVTMDEVRPFRDNALAFASFLALRDDADAASVAVRVSPTHPDWAWAVLAVLPEHRRNGLATALYRTVSDWLRERGINELHAPVGEDDPESFTFAERRGFREVERHGRMTLRLAEIEAPAVEAPPGIEVTTWAERPDLTRAIYEVSCEAVSDIPGEEVSVQDSFDTWLRQAQRPSDLPEATFLALAGDEVVGYAKLNVTAAQPKAGFHDMTGVKRAWRRRGIAGALKRAQIDWAKDHGYERLETEMEVRNEPIRRLNRRLGYRPAPGRVVLSGPLAS